MPSAWKVALGSLLGGVSGGTQGFVDQKNKMREFAIKELEARPGLQKEVEYIESLGGSKMTPEARKKTAITLGTGGLVSEVPGGGITRVDKPRELTEGERLKREAIENATNRIIKANPGMSRSEAREMAVRRYVK